MSEDKQELVSVKDHVEPLLKTNPDRFVIFPIKHMDMWQMYKTHERMFWTEDEIDLSHDLTTWETLSENEQHFIKFVIAFFAASDGIVIENLAESFLQEVQIPEARLFYGMQIQIEGVHQITYGLLLDTFITNSEERTKMIHAIHTIPCIKNKAEWALRWIDKKKASFAERLVAFATVEGVFFSASFCAIFWLKKRNKMPGLAQSNELISRDEGLHTDFACLLYRSHIRNKLTQERVEQIIGDAVKIESAFVADSLPIGVIGMNAKSMMQYVQFVADRLLVALGHQKMFRVTNPFEWMDNISLSGKGNFFERRITEYAKQESKWVQRAARGEEPEKSESRKAKRRDEEGEVEAGEDASFKKHKQVDKDPFAPDALL